LNQGNHRSNTGDNGKQRHQRPIGADLQFAPHFATKAKMLALTIVPTKKRKPKFAFQVGFNPTQSELIIDLLRAPGNGLEGRRPIAHPPVPNAVI
jgi:hypothetical protein